MVALTFHCRSVVLTLSAIIIAAVPVSGLQCFRCTSLGEPEVCGQHFRLTKSNTSFIVDCDGSCLRNVTKTSGTTKYIRDCKSKGGNTFSISVGCQTEGGTESCTCHKDLCNTAVSHTLTPAVVVTLAVAMVTRGRLLHV